MVMLFGEAVLKGRYYQRSANTKIVSSTLRQHFCPNLCLLGSFDFAVGSRQKILSSLIRQNSSFPNSEEILFSIISLIVSILPAPILVFSLPALQLTCSICFLKFRSPEVLLFFHFHVERNMLCLRKATNVFFCGRDRKY